MSIPQEEIINLIQQLAEYKNIRVCVKQSAIIGAITGLSALVGGLMAGKNGALAGAAIGTVASGMIMDDYVSVTYVIKNEMNAEQRKQFIQNAKRILLKLPGPVTLYAILNNENVASGLTSLIESSVRSLGYAI